MAPFEIKITTHNVNNTRIAEVVSDSQIISNAEDAINLLGDLYYQSYDNIIIREENIAAGFFDLKSGMAGEILQKFSNYRVRLAIIGDFTKNTSKSFSDFVYESNSRKHIIFVSSISEALKVLSM